MNWIKKKLGITDLIDKQKRTNELLFSINNHIKELRDLQKAYNKSYHIK